MAYQTLKTFTCMLTLAAHMLKLEQQRRLAWPLSKDDKQIREAFYLKKKKKVFFTVCWEA